MSIKGIGTDIIEINRIKEVMKKREVQFTDKFFTYSESSYCQQKTTPYPYFAVRFAGKEAVVKALGTGFREMKFTDIEIIKDEKGKPMVKLHGEAHKIALEQGIKEIQLSLSHSKEYAVAFAVAIT